MLALVLAPVLALAPDLLPASQRHMVTARLRATDGPAKAPSTSFNPYAKANPADDPADDLPRGQLSSPAQGASVFDPAGMDHLDDVEDADEAAALEVQCAFRPSVGIVYASVATCAMPTP